MKSYYWYWPVPANHGNLHRELGSVRGRIWQIMSDRGGSRCNFDNNSQIIGWPILPRNSVWGRGIGKEKSRTLCGFGAGDDVGGGIQMCEL